MTYNNRAYALGRGNEILREPTSIELIAMRSIKDRGDYHSNELRKLEREWSRITLRYFPWEEPRSHRYRNTKGTA